MIITTAIVAAIAIGVIASYAVIMGFFARVLRRWFDKPEAETWAMLWPAVCLFPL
jgi:hypothetical protein